MSSVGNVEIPDAVTVTSATSSDDEYELVAPLPPSSSDVKSVEEEDVEALMSLASFASADEPVIVIGLPESSSDSGCARRLRLKDHARRPLIR
jgi:hypothetical protein